MSALPTGIRRLGSKEVNFYVLEEDGRATVVDGGVAGYRSQLDKATDATISAVVLTHAHADHVGIAEILRTEFGIPVYVHEADAELARTAKAIGKNEGSMLPYFRYPAAWGLMFELMSHGGAKPRPIKEVRTFTDGEELDVPGRLRAIHTPGHTDGHCALLAESQSTLFAGDAICSRNPLTGDVGPQLMPKSFTRDVGQAIASLDKLVHPRAQVLLPGHGDPVHDAQVAVDTAKRKGPT